MPEKITAENIINNIVENIADNVQHKKSVSFFEEDSSSASARFNRLFGRQKPVHHILGGGKSADVLLWRNKKISASVLSAATAIWVLFEWLNYHLLTLVLLALVLGMVLQFVWTNSSALLNRSPSKVPRLVIPDELFVSIGRSVGAEVNRALRFLQDVSCNGNLKQFIGAALGMLIAAFGDPGIVLSLWAAAVVGSWCNFLTVLYIGFVAAHTLPVLYERYDDKIDDFVYKVVDQFQHQYRNVDAGFLSKIPKGNFKGKKHE